MKTIFGLLLLTVLMTTPSAKAEFTNDAPGLALLTAFSNTSPFEGSGLPIHRTKNMMVVVYDFAVSGGATTGTKLLLDDQGNPATLPKGAIVTNVTADAITSVTSSGSGTLGLQLLTSSDLASAIAKTALAAGDFAAGVPVGTAATWVGPVTAVGGTQMQAIIATAALTAGKVKFFVEYVIQ
jgi:hypothetical protein